MGVQVITQGAKLHLEVVDLLELAIIIGAQGLHAKLVVLAESISGCAIDKCLQDIS